MGAIQELASELDVEERTLRRAAALGTLRTRRLGPRRLQVSDAERAYLRSHWPLLSKLRQALRVRPQVRLAVLYGSAARGDDTPGSDLDLLVSFADDQPDAAMALASWLESRTDRRVDVSRLERISADSPLLLLQSLDEGRVLADRDQQWPLLRQRRRAIQARADRSYRRELRETAEAMRSLTT
jgi:predicted nucleotidyltransferase